MVLVFAVVDLVSADIVVFDTLVCVVFACVLVIHILIIPVVLSRGLVDVESDVTTRVVGDRVVVMGDVSSVTGNEVSSGARDDMSAVTSPDIGVSSVTEFTVQITLG